MSGTVGEERSRGLRSTGNFGIFIYVFDSRSTQLLQARFLRAGPERLIGDRAYDSDPLDERLWANYRIRLIAPHRSNRRADTVTQDQRVLRRYKRRWKIERLFAWLFNFPRLVARYEYYPENFLGFVHLGFIMILLRHHL